MVAAVHAPEDQLVGQGVVILVRDAEVLLALRALSAEEPVVVERDADPELNLAITIVAQKLNPVRESKAHLNQCARPV
jgi:hypothetical protein